MIHPAGVIVYDEIVPVLEENLGSRQIFGDECQKYQSIYTE